MLVTRFASSFLLRIFSQTKCPSNPSPFIQPPFIPATPSRPPTHPLSSHPDKYFTTHLSLSLADATHLHTSYYLTYGLAIEGLVRHHRVDPLSYNAQVDDALPLETVLAVDEDLRTLLDDVDRRKVKLWLFTNAYVNHARRVIRLLGLDRRRLGSVGKGEEVGNGEEQGEYGYFEGLTYCDYGAATNVDPQTGEMEGFIWFVLLHHHLSTLPQHFGLAQITHSSYFQSITHSLPPHHDDPHIQAFFDSNTLSPASHTAACSTKQCKRLVLPPPKTATSSVSHSNPSPCPPPL